MNARGKILRDPRNGPGLLMIEGRQYPFCLNEVWKSDVEPLPGLAVEVKLDRAGEIVAIAPVPESESEQKQRDPGLDRRERKGLNVLRTIAVKCGLQKFLGQGKSHP
jgi:hypothetical protein